MNSFSLALTHRNDGSIWHGLLNSWFELFRMYLPPNSDILKLLAVICKFHKEMRSHETLHLPPNSDVLKLLAVICTFYKEMRSHEALHLPPNY
jgi:hypothetical protein